MASTPLSIPADFAELMRDTQRIRDAFALLNALRTLNVRLVGPNGGVSLDAGRENIIGSPPNLSLPLPLQFPNAWAAPSGTASRATFNADASTTASGSYTQAEVQAINDRLKETRQLLAALILDLRATSMAPNA